MRLYALRHGETSWNVQRRFQGQSDIPLNDKGILLAELTGEGLANVPFDLAFTSPLCRARQTAELVLAGRDVPLYVEPRLIEMAFGVYEGVTANSGPGGTLNQNLVDFICHAERYQAPEGGETFQELSKRMADYLFDLCHRQELADKTILLASHGGAITALLNAIDCHDFPEPCHISHMFALSCRNRTDRIPGCHKLCAGIFLRNDLALICHLAVGRSGLLSVYVKINVFSNRIPLDINRCIEIIDKF